MGPVLRRTIVAAVSGVLLFAAFEPVAWAWTMPLAVAGFVLATRGSDERPFRSGLWAGLVFGVVFYFSHIFWMRAVGIPAWIALSTLEALFYGLVGGASALLQRHRWWPLWFASAWAAIEVLRSGWPLSGMPWGRLAFGVVDTPLAEAMPYAGAVGVSFLAALLGALLAWVVRGAHGPAAGERGRVAAGVALAALVAALAVPALAPRQVEETGDFDVAVVQGDVPGPGDDILYDFRQVTQNHVDATVDLGARVDAGETTRPDLVLWPENSTATDPFADEQTHAGILEAAAAVDVPILVGAIVDGTGPDQVLNQGVVWDPVTGAGERYTKRNPVPFGEYIPWRAVFTKYQFFDRLREVGRDMLHGTRDEPLPVDGVPVADAICFDIAYDDGLVAQLRNGAELLVVQSSNATFIRTDQIDQQFAITRLRAIETGRWVAVATTNGVSGVIAPDGSVVATADPRTRAVLQEQVGLVDSLTPAMRIGPWSGRVAAVLGAFGVLLGLLAYRRSGRGDRSAAPAHDEQENGVTRVSEPA